MSGPAAIPPGAVQAAAKRLQDIQYGSLMRIYGRERVAREMLEAAEAAWPHDPPAVPIAVIPLEPKSRGLEPKRRRSP